MKDNDITARKTKVPYLAMAEALMLVGGILVFVGTCFLNWVSYTFVSDGTTFVRSYKGIDFGRKMLPQYIEVYLIPALAVLIVIASIFSAGRRRSSSSLPLKSFATALRALVLIGGILVMLLALEIVYRFNPTMVNATGLSFWDNARVGWYATLYGSILVIFGAAFSLGRNLRKVGFADYWLIRSPPKEETNVPPQQLPTALAHPMPQLYGPSLPPPPNMQPVQPGQSKPCAGCGKPLEYIPEYQALYCYGCGRYG